MNLKVSTIPIGIDNVQRTLIFSHAVLQIGAADAVYNCAYTDVRPGRSQKVCAVCLFGKVLHKQTRFGTPEHVPWGAGKRALPETRQSYILLFQFDLISCLAKLRHDINSAGVHICQVPCVKRDFSIYTVPKRWNIPLVQHHVLITLIACGVRDFILEGFFFQSRPETSLEMWRNAIHGFQIMTLRASLEESRDYDNLTRRLVKKVCQKHVPVAQ